MRLPTNSYVLVFWIEFKIRAPLSPSALFLTIGILSTYYRKEKGARNGDIVSLVAVGAGGYPQASFRSAISTMRLSSLNYPAIRN